MDRTELKGIIREIIKEELSPVKKLLAEVVKSNRMLLEGSKNGGLIIGEQRQREVPSFLKNISVSGGSTPSTNKPNTTNPLQNILAETAASMTSRDISEMGQL